MASGDPDRLLQRVRHAVATSSHSPVPYPEGVVHQAIGIMMETLGCSNLVALDVLVDRTEATGEGLLAVAVELVNRQGRTPNRRPATPDSRWAAKDELR